MRTLLFALPLMMAATPALAAPKGTPQIPPELSDPAMADKLSRMMGPLTKALLDMPIGEFEAAVAGREATAADKAKRVRDELGPEGQRDLEATVAKAGPQMQAMQKALVASLPAIMKSMEGLERELERATANLPDPTYPKR